MKTFFCEIVKVSTCIIRSIFQDFLVLRRLINDWNLLRLLRLEVSKPASIWKWRSVSEIVTESRIRSRISFFLQFHECFMFLQLSVVIRVVRQLLCPRYGYFVSIHGKNTIDRFQCHALKKEFSESKEIVMWNEINKGGDHYFPSGQVFAFSQTLDIR